jgi:hypothetical protein
MFIVNKNIIPYDDYHFHLRMLLDMDKLFQQVKRNHFVNTMERGSTVTGTKKSFELLIYNLT